MVSAAASDASPAGTISLSLLLIEPPVSVRSFSKSQRVGLSKCCESPKSITEASFAATGTPGKSFKSVVYNDHRRCCAFEAEGASP